MLDRSEWPDTLGDLAQLVLEAVTSVDAAETEDEKYTAASTALASAAAAAFFYASFLLNVDEWQASYAQALFLRITEVPCASFRIVYGDDVLVPGQVQKTFASLDEWFTVLESTDMPERAKILLKCYGQQVDKETRDHWTRLAEKDRR